MIRTVAFDGGRLRLEDVVDLAAGEAAARLDESAAFRARIDKGADLIDALIARNGTVYGVTTGYGENVSVQVSARLASLLPAKLVRYHGVGLGRPFSREETRAIVASRLASLARGYSGVSFALLRGLQALLQKDVLPVIPEEGSVGASGDLTPLSYVAAVLCGEREAWGKEGRTGETESEGNGIGRIPAALALRSAGLEPYVLRPKEALAMMNGTAVMTALACLNFARAEYLTRLCSRLTSLTLAALDGNAGHFAEGLFAVKPFPGMGAAAARIRKDLSQRDADPGGGPLLRGSLPLRGSLLLRGSLQDRYSIRCAPHVIGVLEDCLPWYRDFIETELNSSNDNPIVDAERGVVHHGGHFYGGHICHAMDSMKTTVANLADLVDRQIALLVDPKMNSGLPANLSGALGEESATDHGLKALQITASACTAEALKLCMPASVFSRSTESHNQDKVSLGTIAARDCRRVLELTEQVAACGLLAACQGLELRRRGQGRDGAGPGPEGPLERTLAWTRRRSALVGTDRSLEGDLRALLEGIRARDPEPVSP
ncbi:MAG TPA: aromatic amino acid ammonia-lyase [Fibrobacteria bacterium]|nr:aromatic amino acid ammonia-lyase [Fibrobacteria bacterium]